MAVVKKAKKKAVKKVPLLRLSLAELEEKFNSLDIDDEMRDDAAFCQREEMPFCCGVSVIGELRDIREAWIAGAYDYDKGMYKRDRRLHLTMEQLQVTAAYECKRALIEDKTSTLLATTASGESVIPRVLAAIGFKAAGTAVNPKTKNRVTTWIYTEA